MSEQPKETLSALMDNEVSDFELRRLVQQAGDDSDMSDKWQRYHMVSSVLKQEQFSAGDISASVMDALADEPAYNEKSHGTDTEATGLLSSFIKPLASMAVAASVTAVVILGGQNFGVGQSGSAETIAQTTGPAMTQPGFTVPRDFMRAQYGAPRTIQSEASDEHNIIRLNRGLNNYIRQHQSLVRSQQLQTQPAWIPDGFSQVKSALTPGSDLTVFSNGESSFTVCIERAGSGTVPEGATQVGEMVAVGKKIDQYFVTVVGDVPLMVADRVANSVSKIQ